METLHPHHRRPRSLGGTDDSYNKSWVEKDLHNAWHIMFGNMDAFQIANYINSFDIPYKPDNIYVVCKFINGDEVKKSGSVSNNFSKDESKILASWNKLFGRMKFEKIIAYINNTWLDPSYHLYIKTLTY